MLDASLSQFVNRLASSRPTGIALYDRDQPVTYAQLAEQSRRLATGLAELGVQTGDRVAVWLPNIPAWFTCFFACARLGAIAVAVNTRFKSGEIADIVGRSGAKVVIYWPGFKGIDFVGIMAEADGQAFAAVRAFVVYGEDDAPIPDAIHGIPGHDYRKLVTSAPMRDDHGGPEHGCVIFTTSGTTRAPKFVLHPQRSIIAHANDVATALDLRADDAVVMPSVPFCGVTGFCQATAALAAMRTIVSMPAFDAAEAARLIRRHRVTHTVAIGDMLENLLAAAPDAGCEPERPFPSLRVVGFATFSPTQAQIVPEAEARGLPLLGLYGSSEMQALFSRQMADLAVEERVRGGGKPMSAAASVRVRDPDSGQLLPPGQSGELELAGPSRMLGYFNNPEATREALTQDGYFRSGDLGFLTEDGRFIYQNRMGDVLRLAGFLVSPVEIESYLKEHPAVADAQVVGIEIDGSPRAIAFVIGAEGVPLNEAELIAHCRQRMANYKVPAHILPIDEFPVTPSANGNKIQKAQLRQIAQTRLAETR